MNIYLIFLETIFVPYNKGRNHKIFLNSKFQQDFLDIAMIVQEFIWERKGNNPEKNNKVGGTNLSNFKTY